MAYIFMDESGCLGFDFTNAVKGLQVVDFLSWAIFRKYEHGDDYFYNMIKNLIVEESSLFS